MTETVRFYFDPSCPWAWQTSRWMREVTKVRDVTVDWRLFSLRLVNVDPQDPLTTPEKSVPAVRTLALVGREEGNEAVDRLYRAVGERVHGRGEKLGLDVVRQALGDAGFDPGLVDRAMEDDSTAKSVIESHREALESVQAFGVPTIVLESGRGLFGPVVSLAPQGEAAGELWDRVRWLADQDGFFELKRERDRRAGEPPPPPSPVSLSA